MELVLPFEIIVEIAEQHWRAWIVISATCRRMHAGLLQARFKTLFVYGPTIDTPFYYTYHTWWLHDGSVYKRLSIDSGDYCGYVITYYRGSTRYKRVKWVYKGGILAGYMENSIVH